MHHSRPLLLCQGTVVRRQVWLSQSLLSERGRRILCLFQ
uniref:Uncharacterized protein n=1 Tax=Anguilla anguilla TaxID=7936 RepID=A0A0E9REI7_ANGAN